MEKDDREKTEARIFRYLNFHAFLDSNPDIRLDIVSDDLLAILLSLLEERHATFSREVVETVSKESTFTENRNMTAEQKEEAIRDMIGQFQ